MHKDIELLMALHDGELSADDERRARELLERDPEAKRVMQELEHADRAFSRAADDLLNAPVPQRLLDAVQAERAEPAPRGNVHPFPRRKALVSLAMAAGLAAVIVFAPRPPPGVGDGDRDSYAALLQQTLESAASGDIRSSEDGLAQVSPVVTYRTGDARFCREYVARRGDEELSGIACRSRSGTWDVLGQQALGAADDGSRYRAAGRDEDRGPALDLDAASTLSYAEESAALSSGWAASGSEGAQQ